MLQKRNDHGVKCTVHMHITALAAIARRCEGEQGTANVIMGALHRGATGQRNNDRPPVQRHKLTCKISQIKFTVRMAGNLNGRNTQNTRSVWQGIMCVCAVQKNGIRQHFAAQIQTPKITFGSAGPDRPPILIQIVATPQPHQPGDRFAFLGANV